MIPSGNLSSGLAMSLAASTVNSSKYLTLAKLLPFGAGEMVLWVKHLQDKLGDLSSNPQHPHTGGHMGGRNKRTPRSSHQPGLGNNKQKETSSQMRGKAKAETQGSPSRHL